VTIEDEFGVSKADQKRMSTLPNPSPSSGSFTKGDEVILKTGSSVELMADRYTKEAHNASAAGLDLAQIMQGRSLILSCFHLPVELKRNPGTGGWVAQWNDSLIARSDHSIAGEMKTYWVGTVNSGRDRVLTEADMISIRKALLPMNCYPIFAAQELVDRAYLGFCKQQMWPSFHNVDMLDLTNACWNSDSFVSNPELSWDQSALQGQWEAYEELSRIFAVTVVSIIADKQLCPNGTVLWVHDYHLMLLPKMINDSEVAASGSRSTKIVFFLHIPFSTSQIFRSLQHGQELLTGILNADVVGFHAFDHARHFLNACKRNLGLKFQARAGGLLGVEFEGRTVSVVMRHVSIETVKLVRKMNECGGKDEAAAIRAKHAGRRIVCGLDVCQRLSGVALKLVGIERLLDEFPRWRGQVVLVQRCFLPRNRLDDEERTSGELKLLVARINAKYPGAVDYEEIEGSRLTSGKRLGLWLASDVMLNTAVREGLNLDCFEFLFVKEDPGVIVASEFGTTVSVLNGAIRINPFDIKSWKASLDEALSMTLEERRGRKERDIDYVTSRPSPLWTKQILNDMMSMSETVNASGVGRASSVIFTDDALPMGAGGNFSTEEGFALLQPERAADAYRTTSRRVFIFDYGGTLRENERAGKYIKDDINPCHKGRDLPPAIVNALKRLSEDPNNAVYVSSGLAKDPLEFPFRDLPRIGLAAQNGLCFSLAAGAIAHGRVRTFQPLPDRLDGKVRSERRWYVPDFGVDWDAVKGIALPILNRYTGRTNGSSIRYREPSLAWSYYRSDPEWGIMQAGKLKEELESALSPFNVQVSLMSLLLQPTPR
jgi:trehalose 6-phosphate synthase/phosphatase